MSIPNNPNEVAFAKKRWFRLPWQSPYKNIEEPQASARLSQGADVWVQESPDLPFLPAHSARDVAEVKGFSRDQVSGELQDTHLATDLLKMKKEGMEFYGVVEGERKEIGAYGAYNFLTRDLPIKDLEIVIDESTVRPKDRVAFEDSLNAITFASERVLETPEKYRTRHLGLLYRGAYGKGKEFDSAEAVKGALQYTKKDDWNPKGPDLGVAGALGKNLDLPEARSSLITEVASAVDHRGMKRLENVKSIVSLYEAAVDAGSDDRAFFSQAVEGAGHPDELYLTRALGLRLFPEQLKRAEELTSPDYVTPRRQLLFLNTILQNPEVEDPVELTQLAVEHFLKKSYQRDERNQLRVLMLENLAPNQPRSKVALDIVLEKEDKWPEARSVEALYRAVQEPKLSELDMVMKVLAEADQKDRGYLTQGLSDWILRDVGFELPLDVREFLASGEATDSETREILETLLQPDSESKALETEIGVEEDLITIGNEELEVDL